MILYKYIYYLFINKYQIKPHKVDKVQSLLSIINI